MLAAAAVYNIYRTRKVERDHPPSGQFITVDGVRLHYLEKGEGPPVVLIHGNVVTAEDFVLSGVFDRIARNHRVIAFDRPGYGYSERPQGSMWTAVEQADLLQEAFDRSASSGPSWWATPGARWWPWNSPSANRMPSAALSCWGATTSRPCGLDVPLVAPPAIPVIGDVLRYTVSPLMGAALMPLNVKAMFAPSTCRNASSGNSPTASRCVRGRSAPSPRMPSRWCRPCSGWRIASAN